MILSVPYTAHTPPAKSSASGYIDCVPSSLSQWPHQRKIIEELYTHVPLTATACCNEQIPHILTEALQAQTAGNGSEMTRFLVTHIHTHTHTRTHTRAHTHTHTHIYILVYMYILGSYYSLTQMDPFDQIDPEWYF